MRSDLVRALLSVYWDDNYWKILRKLFLPYVFYLMIVLWYMTHAICVAKDDRPEYHYILGIVALCSIAYQLIIVESLQAKYDIRGYLTNPMNWIDLSAYVMNTLLIVSTVITVEFFTIDTRCVLCAVLAAIMWLKMLDWLRLFDSTAFFIKLILQTIIDVMPFFVIFFVFLFMFGTAFYLLSMSRPEDA